MHGLLDGRGALSALEMPLRAAAAEAAMDMSAIAMGLDSSHPACRVCTDCAGLLPAGRSQLMRERSSDNFVRVQSAGSEELGQKVSCSRGQTRPDATFPRHTGMQHEQDALDTSRFGCRFRPDSEPDAPPSAAAARPPPRARRRLATASAEPHPTHQRTGCHPTTRSSLRLLAIIDLMTYRLTSENTISVVMTHTNGAVPHRNDRAH
jgi:hypothetical protein